MEVRGWRGVREGPPARECRWHVETEKGKNIDSVQYPPEGMQPS